MTSKAVFSDDVGEKIVAYVDCEDGRESPLTADEEVMAAKLLEGDPEAQRQANDMRDINATLHVIADDPAEVSVPASLINMIDGLGFEIERIRTTAALGASSIKLETRDSILADTKTRMAELSDDLASLDQTFGKLNSASFVQRSIKTCLPGTRYLEQWENIT